MPCYTHCTTHTSKEHTHSLIHSASEAVRVPLLIQSLPRVKNFPQHRAHVQIVASANNANECEILRAVSFTARGGKCVPCVHAGTRTQSECTRGKCLCRYTQVVKYIIQFQSGVDGRIIIMVSVQEGIGCVYAVATCKMGYNDEVQFQSGVDGRVILW